MAADRQTCSAPASVARSFPGSVPPHGGELIDRRLTGEAREEALARAAGLPPLELDEQEQADLEMIATGAMSPLEGFMGEKDYESVIAEMRLASGLVWALPVTLSVDRVRAAGVAPDGEVSLVDGSGRVLGLMRVEDRFIPDRQREAEAVFGTTDGAHPAVGRLADLGEVCLGGPIRLIDTPGTGEFAEFRLTPRQTRMAFDGRGWRQVVAFQTRNPLHRAHEYLQKCALEMVDGLLLHPLVGATKPGDVPAEVRMRTYRELLEDYYPRDRVLLSVFPAAMRYAGPREAVFHAICRKNYGCTHFIVGRDHAGVGDYYGTYDAQRIFDRFDAAEIGVTILRFENSFYCRRCGNLATAKTCPHGPEDHLFLSGTKVRAMLRRGELPPPEFMRPEVARILRTAAAD